MAPPKLNWENVDPAVHFRYAAKPLKGSQHDGYSISLRVIDPASGEEVMFLHQAPELFLTFGIKEKEVGERVQYRSVFSIPFLHHPKCRSTRTLPSHHYKTWLQLHCCERIISL